MISPGYPIVVTGQLRIGELQSIERNAIALIRCNGWLTIARYFKQRVSGEQISPKDKTDRLCISHKNCLAANSDQHAHANHHKRAIISHSCAM